MFPARVNAIRSMKPNIKVSFFSDDDIERIFAYIDDRIVKDRARRANNMTYKVLLTLLLRTGARISEALAVRPQDIDLMTGNISLITLKKNQRTDAMKEYAIKKIPRRTIPLHPELKDVATAYFLEMHVDVKSADPIFHMSRMTVDKYLTRMEGATDIRINAHKFRHTFAVRSLLDGVPINVVQKWLAHSSLIVTSVYADILSMDTSMFMKQVH